MRPNENDRRSGADEIADGVGPVVADLRIESGCLRAVTFSNVPSIRPVERRVSQLAEIAAALEGLPADMEELALAARIRAAIPYGTEVWQDASQSMARAVRQAIGPLQLEPRIGRFTAEDIAELTDSWTRLPWRIIPATPLSAAANVALDEVLSDRGEACLRFWHWSEPAVIVGRCQSIQNEVDRDAMVANGVVLVRRLTGGGAMFVQPHGTITYSLVLPEDAVAGLTIRQSYEVCDAWVVQGLRELDIDAHHVPVNDIACVAGKIGGAAQARRRGMVLHHTTLAYDLKMDEMARVLRIGREKRTTNAVASAAKVVSPLTSQTKHSRERIVDHLQHRFRTAYGGSLVELSMADLARTDDLVRVKYAHPDWTDEFA